MEDALVEFERIRNEREVWRRMAEDPVFRALAAENKKAGDTFLKNYAAREGVQSTPTLSGTSRAICVGGPASHPSPMARPRCSVSRSAGSMSPFTR